MALKTLLVISSQALGCIMTKLRYTVVYGNTITELCKNVNEYLEDGYLLQGGVTPTAEGRPGYHQALTSIEVVKEKKK